MALRVIRLLKSNKTHWRYFHTTQRLPAFFEYDRKSGYPHVSDYKPVEKSHTQRVKDGYHQFKEESMRLFEEIMEQFRMDPEWLADSGEPKAIWKFNGDSSILDDFIKTSDSDMHDGRSVCDLDLTPDGKGIFYGILDTQPIKDGRAKKAGYCNIRTVRPVKSFYRDHVHDWHMYTHLVMRIRGDGRNYMINIHVNNTFDAMWNDLHNFVLYTRGGPYWQYVKIPFSKFYLSHRGRVQDSQARVILHFVTALSITAADDIPGPFKLEIDFIGVERDIECTEEFAYELYKPPHPYYT